MLIFLGTTLFHELLGVENSVLFIVQKMGFNIWPTKLYLYNRTGSLLSVMSCGYLFISVLSLCIAVNKYMIPIRRDFCTVKSCYGVSLCP